ncbi:MAG: hypothetical protein JNJ54_34555 [Myxococcaceae bacterium]|nr:hypothetical protein [Myxococcaceae bacterium]
MRGAALAISALGVPWALLATFKLGPTFSAMFADFATALPWLTMLVLQPWAPLALALGSFVAVAVSSTAAPKWAPLVIALATLAAQVALFLIGMYLPIWSLAGQVR